MTTPLHNITFRVSPAARIGMLICTFIIGFLVAAVLGGLLIAIGGAERHTAMLRIATVCQDLFMLALPALITATLICNNGARLLGALSAPKPLFLLAMCGITLVSIPMMNIIIEWNANLRLPEALSALENALRAMEENAADSVLAIMGSHTIPNLILNILIIGIMAGVCEELLFRGALLRILISCGSKPHAAVWISAIIFSAIHFQFFGFVPRMLLGAFFGYLMIWSGSVWLPIAAHTLNNTLYVLAFYFTGAEDVNVPGNPVVVALVSLVLTALLLAYLYKHRTISNNYETT